MKKTASTLACLATITIFTSPAPAATVNYSTSTTGNRVVITTSPFVPTTTGTLVLGTMSDETDFSTFSEFGRSSLGSNNAFPTGGVISGGAVNNTVGAADFASKPIYLAIYTEGNTHAGIYKSTTSFDAGISGSASTTYNVEVTSFTTAINPSKNWSFGPVGVDPQGFTGEAGGTPRTGIVFYLGIPEPSTGVLALAALGLAVRRRR